MQGPNHDHAEMAAYRKFNFALDSLKKKISLVSSCGLCMEASEQLKHLQKLV